MTEQEKAFEAFQKKERNDKRQATMLAEFEKIVARGQDGVDKVKAMLDAKAMKDEDKIAAIADFRACLNALSSVDAPDQA